MSTLTLAIVLAAAIFVLAATLRALRVPQSVRLKRSVVIFGVFLACVGLRQVVGRWLPEFGFTVFNLVAELLAILVVINLCALFVFDVGARAIKVRAPDILHDLIVGAAYLLAGLWLMHRAGVNLASIVATSAVATAVLGLSLQSTLGSVIGGLSLQADDSINEGDWIEMPDKTQGLVRQIRWRHTVVETRDWDTLLVPNNQLLNQTIKILGKRIGEPRQHRMWVYFQVDFRFSPTRVAQVVEDALHAAPLANVALHPLPNVICVDLAKDLRDSVALYAVRYWLTDLAKDDPTSSAVRERVYAALRRAEIPLAVPAATLFVNQEDPERDMEKRNREVRRVSTALSQVSLFRTLSEAELQQLADSVRVVPFSPQELITRQGAEANWLYVLTKGEVEVRIAAGDRSRKVNTLTAPNYFGEMALVSGAPREATVAATTEVECIRVGRRDFQQLFSNRPQFAADIAAVIGERQGALAATKEGLDAEAQSKRVEGERKRILTSVQEFFGLRD
jgi:small-conductance mechanosensitive channel/CRP-like cAMP-binding protein